MVKQLALNCGWEQRDNDTIHLAVDASHRHFLNDSRRLELQKALSTFLDTAIELKIDIAQAALQFTPARIQQMRRDARFKEAERAIQTDPALKNLIDLFAADITPGSIEPLDDRTQ